MVFHQVDVMALCLDFPDELGSVVRLSSRQLIVF